MTKAEAFALKKADEVWLSTKGIITKDILKRVIRASFVSGKAEGLDSASTAITELQS